MKTLITWCIVAILTITFGWLVRVGILRSNSDEARKQSEFVRVFRELLDPAIVVRDLCHAFTKHEEAKGLHQLATEEPLRFPYETKQLVQTTALDLAIELTRHLRQEWFLKEPCIHEGKFPSGGSFNHYLFVGNRYEIAKAIRSIQKEFLGLTYTDDEIASYDEIQSAIVRYAREVAPELRKRCCATGRVKWDDAAGVLYGLLTEDRVAPSVLGLTKDQVYQILQIANKK